MTGNATTAAGMEIITKVSSVTVAETVARLTAMINAKGMRLFTVIDQRAEARQAGLDMPDTVLVIFGSPKAGTPVMVAAPMAALDLPLKVLVWDDGGQTKVSYYDPAGTVARYQVPGELAGNLAGINALTDALVQVQLSLQRIGIRPRKAAAADLPRSTFVTEKSICPAVT